MGVLGAASVAEFGPRLSFLLKVLAGFVINAANASPVWAGVVSVPSFVLMVGVSALEILVAGIQAYVFALLTSLYINDAEHLH